MALLRLMVGAAGLATTPHTAGLASRAEEVCEQEADASEGAAVNLFASNALAAMSTKRTPQSSQRLRKGLQGRSEGC
jgi:hypothetical protein